MSVKKNDLGCGPALGIWAIALFAVWIVAEAISGLTVGHDISETGCYWVIGVSLAITILLVYWIKTKSAIERTEAQMGWLGDIAKRRGEERQKQEDSYASHLRDQSKESEKAHKMVMAALKEVGRAYWGSVDKSWNVRVFNAGSPNRSWEVQDDADHYWRVSLTRSDPEGWRFAVTANGETLYASNTSEAELKRVLRLAVERGPAFKSYQ